MCIEIFIIIVTCQDRQSSCICKENLQKKKKPACACVLCLVCVCARMLSSVRLQTQLELERVQDEKRMCAGTLQVEIERFEFDRLLGIKVNTCFHCRLCFLIIYISILVYANLKSKRESSWM